MPSFLAGWLFLWLILFSYTPDCSGRSWTGSSAGQGALSRRNAAETADPGGLASRLQALLLKSFVDWVNVDDNSPEGHEGDTDADYEASEQELTSQLQQVLAVAERLLQNHSGCKAGSGGGAGGRNAGQPGWLSPSAACPAPAPELLQGRTSAFLASLLRTYPRGPTSRQDLVAWASAAAAFLQEHANKQRKQRKDAEQAADLEAAVLAQAQAAARKTTGDAAAATIKTARIVGKAKTADGTGPWPTPAPAAAAPAAKLPQPQQQKPKQQQQQQEEEQQQPQPQQLQQQLDQQPQNQQQPKPQRLEQQQQQQGTSEAVASRGATPPGGSRRRLVVADPGAGPSAAAAAAAAATSHVPHRLAAPDASAAAAGGLPLVRRVLLAQLLLGWMSAEMRQELPTSPDVTEALRQLLTLLYDIHVTSVVDRAALEYFHISKAGGTSFTAAAKANGCVIPRFKAARTPEFDDDCRWFDPGVLTGLGLSKTQAASSLVCPRYGLIERRSRLRDCARRLDHFRHTGLQYTNNEYTLHGGRYDMYGTHICPQFVTVATIREPLERLVSNIKYMMVQLKRDKAMPRGVFQAAFCNRSASVWETYAPPVADNYNIRTLIGERGFHTPLYEIGEAHEALAKQLMAQFDLLLDLNAGDAAAALMMRQGLGWNTTLADVHIWTSDKLARKGALDFASCPVGDIQPLLERQGYDQRWYSFCRALARLDQLFLSAATQLGSKPWPADWEEGPPPDEGWVDEACGLVGLVPPPPAAPQGA